MKSGRKYISKAGRTLISMAESLREGLERLDETQERVLICVDKDKRLAGVLSDGDVRRAFLQGASLTDPVSRWMQKDPVFVTTQSKSEESMRYVSDRIRIVPVVNARHQVVDYHSFRRKPEYLSGKSNCVTVIGMGYVGLTLAATLVDLGFRVIGYDLNKKLIASLRKKKSHFYEKGLQKYLDHFVGRNLSFTADLSHAKSEIYVITVGTPLNKATKTPILNHVTVAAAEVGKYLKGGDLVVLRSTVPVGCTRKFIIPILEKEAGLKAGKDFFVSFAPERTIEGKALQELRVNPQIIGSFDPHSTALTSQLFNRITKSVIDVGSLEAAEICKLIDNSFRDHKFAFVNQLTVLSEKLGLDLSNLVEALNHGYSRNFIPKPSPGVGGPCLSKDPYILASVFREHGLDASMIYNARAINEAGPENVLKTLRQLLREAGKNIKNAKIFLIGIAFKGSPETSDMRDSTSVAFHNLLPNKAKVYVFDPVISQQELSAQGFKPARSIEDGFRNADAVVILNNNPKYQDLNIFKLCSSMKKPAVFIDTWHVFEPQDIKRISGILYGGVGNT